MKNEEISKFADKVKTRDSVKEANSLIKQVDYNEDIFDVLGKEENMDVDLKYNHIAGLASQGNVFSKLAAPDEMMMGDGKDKPGIPDDLIKKIKEMPDEEGDEPFDEDETDIDFSGENDEDRDLEGIFEREEDAPEEVKELTPGEEKEEMLTAMTKIKAKTIQPFGSGVLSDDIMESLSKSFGEVKTAFKVKKKIKVAYDPGEMAYVYQADLYCEDCGNKIKQQLDAEGKSPESPEDEYTFDSDEYPKGPYGEGGGEADSPHHCAGCQKFLDNPLTSEGYNYVREQAESGSIPEEWKQYLTH